MKELSPPESIFLSCGCRANATDGNGKPSCVIHAGLIDSEPIPVPNMAGRTARCSCGKTKPSDSWHTLPFFEFRGDGSPSATESCKHCGYFRVAHTPEAMARNNGLKCVNFESHGAWGFDSYYCGCRGWD